MKGEEVKYWIIAKICETEDKEDLIKLLENAICFVSGNMED
jgi:hypothetical protein